jgi:hypothetical protein
VCPCHQTQRVLTACKCGRQLGGRERRVRSGGQSSRMVLQCRRQAMGKTPQAVKNRVTKCYRKPRACADPLGGPTQEKHTTVILAVVGVGVNREKCVMRFMSRTPHQLLDCLALRSFAASGSTSTTSEHYVADYLQHHPLPNWHTRLQIAVTSANRPCVCR